MREVFADTYLHQPPAMGIHLAVLLGQFEAACTAADEPAKAAIAHIEQQPDAAIFTSFRGLGMLAGARMLAEIGDDRSRFAYARGLKEFAGSAPITRASGKKTVVLHRHIKNRRPSARSGPWDRCAPGRAHVATPTPAAPPETGTTKPNDTCSTNFSVNFTTACRPVCSTTDTWRSHLLSTSRLDF